MFSPDTFSPNAISSELNGILIFLGIGLVILVGCLFLSRVVEKRENRKIRLHEGDGD